MGDTGDSTYDEDFLAGRKEQIKERTNRIFRSMFLGVSLNERDQQYFVDYIEGKHRRKPNSPEEKR